MVARIGVRDATAAGRDPLQPAGVERLEVRNLITNKSFSARIVDKDRVLVTTRLSPSAKGAKE